MGSTLTLELPAQPVSHHDEDVGAASGGAVASLGVWMAILGAVRLACEVTEYTYTLREALGSQGAIATRGWTSFLNANPPVYVLISVWPLLLGLALWRSQWRELVKAGALTFLVLSIGGVITAIADWSQSTSRWIAIGSFGVRPMEWDRLSAAGTMMGLAGVAQLLLELVVAAWAIVLITRRGDGDSPIIDRPVGARRLRWGRLAVYLSAAFLVLTIRLPAWSAYLELLSQSQWIREFILRDDFARIRSTRPAFPRQARWVSEVRELLHEGETAWQAGRYAASSDSYTHVAALLDSVPTLTMSAGERGLAAQSLNNWAWLLATCPEKGLQRPEESVKYARRALELQPNEGSTWNTLGVAYFRLGALDDALSALYRSMELRDEGDSADWFVLSMIHVRLGHKDRAREWYDKAVQWSHRYRPGDDELYRFEVEAAQALGLPKPEKQKSPPVPDAWQRRYQPMGPHFIPGRRGRPMMRDGRREWAPGSTHFERPPMGPRSSPS
jgi:tetratricopeptide (TPR) repeat protein